MKRRERANMLRDAGAAQIATFSLAYQIRNIPSATNPSKRKAAVNMTKDAKSSRTL